MANPMKLVQKYGRYLWACEFCDLVKYGKAAAQRHRCPVVWARWR